MANESANANASNLNDGTASDVEGTSNGQEINVTLVDGVCVVTTDDVTSSLTAPIFIEKPAAGETAEIEVVPGQKYFFDFEEGSVEAFVQEGDNLTLQFADGSSVVLNGFGSAAGSALPATLAFSDALSTDQLANMIQVVDTTPDADELDEPQAEMRDGEEEVSDSGETDGGDVASIQPAAGEEQTTAEEVANVEPEAGEPSAQDLANIEPAAGDDGAGANGNTGFSFENFDATPVGALDAVGPLDPTALQYAVTEPTPDLLAIEEEQDDVPELTSPAEINLDETNLGPLTFTDTLDFDFGNDGPGTLTPDGGFTYGGSALGGSLTSGGQVVDVVATADGYVGTINGGATTVFDLVINPKTGEYTFNQYEVLDHADANDPNDVITLEFGVVATDADGDKASTDIVVNIADDAPAVAAPDENTVDEANLGPIVINDTLVIDFGNDVPGTVTPEGTSSVTGVTTLTSGGDVITITQTADGYIGTLPGGATAFELVIDAATGAYTYTQNVPFDHNAAIDTITLDFAVNVTDYDGDTTQTNIIVNINDSVPEINDNPTVGAGVENIDESDIPGGTNVNGSVDVDFGGDTPGALNPNGTVTISGSSAAGTSLTSGGQPVTITQTTDGYVGTINGGADTVFTLFIDSTNGDYNFTQELPLDHADPNNPDDVITIEFGIIATDGDGDTDTGSITINIADDAPIANDDTNSAVESQTVTGNILANDDGGNDSPATITEFNGTTIPAGGLVVNGTYGVLTIQQDGSYSYTANSNNPQGVDSFPYTLTDSDGDSSDATLTINVSAIDDKPDVNKGFEVVDETDLSGGDIVVNGNLTADYGTDGPGTITPNDTFNFSGSALGGNLTSGGVPVDVALVGNTYVGTAAGQPIFTLDVNTDGSYTFTLQGTLDHADPNDPNDIITLEFGVNASDSDDDVTPTTITVNVLDDVPTIGDSAGDVDETNFDQGNLTYSDTLFTSFGTEAGTIVPGGNAEATVNGNPIALTSEGQAVTITQTADGYVGTVNGGADTVFTVTVNPTTGQYTYTQFATLDHPDGTDPNDTIEISFDMDVTSTDGDTDTGTIVISVADDGVTANDDANGAEEGQDITGNVLSNDDLSEDTPNTVSEVGFNGTPYTVDPVNGATIDTPLGRLTINADGSYTFEAADNGDPDGTAEFTYTLVDGDGDSDTAVLSIRVTPDGQPVAVTAEQTVDETNLSPGPLVINETINVDFGLDGAGTITPNGTVTPGGSLAGGSLTSGGQPVDIQATANGYVGVIAGTTTQVFELIVSNNGDYSFELFQTLDHADETDPNDNITLDFGITIADSDGDTATGSITINVLDDAPVALDDVNSIPENQTTATGNVRANDDDGEDMPASVTQVSFGTNSVTVVAGTPTVINGDHGVLTINADGTYSYTSNGTNTAAVTDVFTYELTDFDGDTDTAELTINIADVDYKPIIADPAPLVVDETDITDTDGDTITANFGNDGPGTFTVTGAGTFTHSGGTGGQLTSDGEPVTVTVQGNGYVGTTAGGETIFTLTLNNTTGEYDFTLTGVLDHADTTDPDDIIELSFGVTATDADGDIDTGSIVVQVHDDGPVANDDCNKFTITNTAKDYNVVMALDISGSMTGDKIALLKSSVTNLLTDFNDYDGGEIKVHLVPFSNNAGAGATFTVTDAAGFNAAIDYLNGLNANGTTNYEAPLQSAISWLNGDTDNDPIAGADTYTYFVSDGEPNRYLNNSGNVTSGSGDVVMGEISGTDGTNEIADLQALSTEVIGVGIGVNSTTLARLGQIDSDGTALDVQDPTDLDAALQGTNPLAGQTSGNVITGAGQTPGGADDLSNDVENTVTLVSFNGTDVVVDPVSGATIDGQYGTLTIFADGSYTYKVTAQNLTGNILEEFDYTLTDGDGDTSIATLQLKGQFLADDRPDLTTSGVVVDETDLNPTDDASNTIIADFGADGPGTYALVGLNGFNGGLNNQLTSNGVSVSVTNESGDLVGRAAGDEVFRLVLNETTGEYTFTLSGTLDHANANNPDDVIQLLFSVQAEDSDGDTDSGIITVSVNDDGPIAHDDHNSYDANTGVANGNVITGLNGGPGAADDLSQDNGSTEGSDHDVVQVRFGTTTVDIPAGGSNTIAGNYGVLEIADDGSYTYTLNPGVTVPTGGTASLDPTAADVAGTQSSITINGITVTSVTGGDLRWLDHTGTGIGINNGAKVHPAPESLNIDFALAQKVTFTIGDIGSNNLTSDLKFILTFQDGSTEEVIFDIATTTPVNGLITVAFDSANFGGKLIDSVESPYYQSSYVLNNVEVEYAGDDCIMDEFEYVLQDGDGDQSTATLELCGKDLQDDVPVLTTTDVSVDETDMNPTDEASNTVSADFGADGPGTFEVSGAGTFGYSGQEGAQLTSNGVPVTVAVVGNSYVGSAGGETIFTLELNETTGQYDFTLIGTLDHGNQNNHNDVIELTFGVNAVDSDGDIDSGLITVDVYDDGPSISGKAKPIDEDTLTDATPISYTHTLNHDYGQDGAGEIRPTNTFSAKFQMGGPDVTLTSGGDTIVVTETADGYIGVAGGETVFTLSVQNNGQYTYTQFKPVDHPDGNNPDDVIWLKFGVQIVDADGDTANAMITVDLHDGAPTAVDDTDSTTGNTATGNVITNDETGPDTPVSVTMIDGQNVTTGGTTVSGTYGNLTINPDGSYTYVANGGNTTAVTDVFTYKLTDFDGDSDEATLTINVGIQDVDTQPEISNSSVVVDETDLNPTDDASNSITADFGADGPGTYALIGLNGFDGAKNGQLTSNGTAVNVGNEGGDLVGRAGGDEIFRLVLNETTGQYTFTLSGTLDHADPNNPDDIIRLRFDVQAEDTDGDTDDGLITVKVKDDGPVAADDTNSAIEGGTVSGNVITNDDVGADKPGVITQIDGQNIAAGGTTVNGTYGSLTIHRDGSYSYTANANNPDGTDTFTYKLVDADGDPATAKLSIVVSPEDATPTVVNASNSVDETGGFDVVNGTINVNYNGDAAGAVTANGTFSSSDATLTSLGQTINVARSGNTYTGTAGGRTIFTMKINTNGTYRFEQLDQIDHPNASDANDNVALRFGVTATDGDGDTGTGTVTINVRDDGPHAVNDTNSAIEGGTVSGNVITNDTVGADAPGKITSVNGQAISSSGTTINGTYGSLVIKSDGSYSYTANPNNPDGVDTFNYTLRDYDGDTDTATLKVTVTPEDATPTVVNASNSVDETGGFDVVNGTINVNYNGDAAGAVTANGTFSSSDATLTSLGQTINVARSGNTYTGTAGGRTIFTMKINTNGTYRFEQLDQIDHPNASDANDNVALRFGVTATDGDGDTGTGTVTINVRDDGPHAVNDTNSAIEGGTVSGNVITNDTVGADAPGKITSVNGQAISSSGTTINGTYGSLVIKSDGSYSYTANPNNPDGVDTFNYTLRDYDGDTDTATLKVTVTPEDATPTVVNASNSVDETGGFDVVNGTINVNYNGDAAGAVTANGTFSSSDATLTSLGQTINVARSGNTYTGTAGGRTIFTMKINTNGTYRFEQLDQIDHPNASDANDNVALRFGVTATDGDGDTGTGTVTINVRDDGPHAVNDTNSAIEGGTVSGNVITNDTVGADAPGKITSVNGQAISSSGTTINGTYGSLVIKSDGSYSYTANPNNPDGVDTFNYTLRDYDGDTDTATLKVTVTPEDATPTVTGSTKTVDETGGFDTVNGSITVDYNGDGPGSVMANGTFTSSDATLTSLGQTINVTNTGTTYTGTAGGRTIFTLKVNADGTYTFKQLDQIDHPNASDANDNVQLRFGVKATDADGDVGSALIKINVRDDGPNAVNDTRSVQEDNTINGNVMGNDAVGADAPGKITHVDGLSIGSGGRTINGTYGTLTINRDGSYTYKAKTNNNPDGVDTFTYTLVDADGDKDTATLKIDVSPKDTVPVANDDRITETDLAGGNVYRGNLLDNDNFRDDGPGSPAIIHGDGFYRFDHGTLEIKTNGEFTLTLNRSVTYNHNYTLNYTIQDKDGDTASAVLRFSVTPLAIDLDGDGIELTNVINGVQFDYDVDGETEQTAWVQSDDGFLVQDRNGDGVINDRSEMFGDMYGFADGFAHLASLDSNGDGQITSEDEQWTELKVWRDLDQDGVSDEGELFGLDELEIASIDLNAQSTDDLVEGNYVSAVSSYTTTDGESHDIVDVHLEYTENNAEDQAMMDLSNYLTGYDALQESIDDFVFNADTAEAIANPADTAGAEVASNATAAAVLESVTGLSVEQIVKTEGDA